MNLPISDPILIMALATLIFLVIPMLFARLKIPSIIGLILAGAIIGPFALNLLERDSTIQLLGDVGLVYLMFVAGLEIDLIDFNKNRKTSIVFGLLTFGFPLSLAFLSYYLPDTNFGWQAMLLIGAIVASHTPIAYPVASLLGIQKNPAVTTAMGGTIITDTLSLLVLAFVAATVEGDTSFLFWLQKIVALLAFAVVGVLGLPRLGRWFFRNVGNNAVAQYVFLLTVLFVMSYLAELAGAKAIIGAFIAGLSLNTLVPDTSALMNRMQFVGNALFIPFFLLSVGMLVDVRVLLSPSVWVMAIFLNIILFSGKWAASTITQRVFRYSNTQGYIIFGLSLPQAAATLAVTFVGFDIGLFNSDVLNAVIVLIVTSCVVGTWLVEKYGRKLALEEESIPSKADEAPHRILIPLMSRQTSEVLIDVASMIREPTFNEPLFPLTVVPESDNPNAQVANAEKALAHAVVYASGAEIPTTPLTRVAESPALGMMRAITEQRITDVVVAWDGHYSGGQRSFGSMIDQLLEYSEQSVLISKITSFALNTSERMLVVLPPLIDHHPGYYQALRTIKLLATRLSVNLLCVVVQGNQERFRRDFQEGKPATTQSFIQVDGWEALNATLKRVYQDHDLPLLLTARRGTLAWTPPLSRLPQQFNEMFENFLVLYPADVMSTKASKTFSGMPIELSPQRILFNMPASGLGAAVKSLLSTEFAEDSLQFKGVLEALVNDAIGYSIEVLPEALIAHARIAGIREGMMFLGLSSAGVTSREAQECRYAVALLLSPSDEPAHQHLERLARLGRFISSSNATQISSCDSFSDLQMWANRTRVDSATGNSASAVLSSKPNPA